ncbi:uncharacterized protein [Aegilops tauschii subsp. strangulata]|uniref:uncharacterized protein n=1 Tax=Aegilops tauschii subsp. strangulata TaxID=200361 RepID=UPI001ABC7C15|nr:uncharacterized protein LOC120976078 [Aegilops tauschii subsp. strangulata]
MMHAVLEDAERADEHVLNFIGLINGHRVLNRSFDTDGRLLCRDALFDGHFRRHFRMCKTILDRLYHDGRSYDDYFILNMDAMGTIVFSGYHKCTTALWVLAYGTAADSWDEYLRMSERTCGDAMVRFATVMVEVFGPQYLRESTVADTERLLPISGARGWTGMLGSLDCMR